MSATSLTRRFDLSWRGLLMSLGVLRFVVAIAAIPLAPLLYRDHFLVLLLMRPTKELFLAGGFLMRQAEVPELVDLAGGPTSIAYTVAAGYLLGEAYERAGPWLAALGAVVLVVFAFVLGRALKKEPGR